MKTSFRGKTIYISGFSPESSW